ncbi:MAG: hypothetical protein KF819_41010 [Labilithrix sp.]|nr:hypothetical protein [Labilithrix sp.]
MPSAPKRLVLVKWHGDVIAAHTVAHGDPLPTSAEAHGVSTEVHDVAETRTSLDLRPSIDTPAALGLLTSMGAHLVFVAVVLVGLAIRSPEALAADEANERAARLERWAALVAASDGDRDRDRQAEDERRGTRSSDDDGLTAAKLAPTAIARDAPESSSGHDAISASPAVCTKRVMPEATGATCTKTVVVTSLASQPGCFTDTVVAVGQRGTLRYPCDGEGPASLGFSSKTHGSKQFDGGGSKRAVDVCTGTEFDFSDGCTWTSAQRVSGSIERGTLQFAYGEAPKAGQESKACASACTARGTLRVEAF